MPIRDIIRILIGYKRYLDYINCHGYDEVIETIKENGSTLLITVRGHMGETYEHEVYISEATGELCVENSITHESVFDYLNETDGMNESILQKLKYGMAHDLIDFIK